MRDDPEKRIRDLERELAGMRTGGAGPVFGPGFASPPGRRRPRWPLYAVLAVVIVLPVALILVQVLNSVRNSAAKPNTGASTTTPPITLERGATFSLGGSSSNDTVACNDGNLTLNANNSTIKITGHCASLQVRGFDSRVDVGSTDVLEVSGYGNTITASECNNGKLTFAGYGNAFTAGGHCVSFTVDGWGNRLQAGSVDTVALTNFGGRISVAGLCGGVTVAAYDNQVRCGSASTIEVAGYDNTVTYHTGSPKITNSGRNNVVKQG